MSIIAINTNTTGLTGQTVNPRRCTMITTDNLAAVTTAGYLNNQNTSGNPIFPTDVFEILYSFNTATQAGTFGIFTVSYSASTGYTLTEWVNPGNVVTPVTIGNLAVYSNANGQISQNIASLNNVANSSATPGTVRSIHGEIISSATTMTSGNLVGVRGSVSYVGASGGFVYGAQGKVIPSGTLSGSEWSAGLFGQLDISGATINAGQIAPVWADYGTSSGTITSATGMRMFAGTNTTAATLNSMIYLYGKATSLFELDLNGSTYISSGGAGTLSGTINKIAITVEGVTYYIPCATVIS